MSESLKGLKGTIVLCYLTRKKTPKTIIRETMGIVQFKTSLLRTQEKNSMKK